MKTINKIFAGAVLFALAGRLYCQEALKSTEEKYYDMLSLDGTTTRSYLSYRTLSDSVWYFTEQEQDDSEISEQADLHPWSQNRLEKKHPLFGKLSYRIYGPEWYNSYNTESPWGQNDGAMWQGVGYNTSFTGGARIEGYGLELTFKPQLSFSQNKPYDYKTPEGFKAEKYKGLADTYGYFWGSDRDLVQRFGDTSFWTWDYGDTEIRYSWKTLTIGAGFQSIWLGPMYVNPLLHSNNGASYPKIDAGLRKQKVIIPKIGWDLGYIEGRIWTGYLTESDYFDNNPSNDHNLIHGLSLSYAPSFMPGLTLNAQRTCLVKASFKNLAYVIPKYKNTGLVTGNGEDQKMALTADWLFPEAGFEVYGELGIDDFLPSGTSYFQSYMRWPFHTATYAVGLRKVFNHKNIPDLKTELIFEWNNSEPSQDYQFWATYNFGGHHQIIQGYTNRGQTLGSGCYGGNSQYLEYNLYYPKGMTSLFVGRNNPDNAYIFGKAVNASAVDKNGNYMLSAKYLTAFKGNFYIGGETKYFVLPDFTLGGGLLYNMIINPKYNPEKDSSGRYRINQIVHNAQLKFTAKKMF